MPKIQALGITQEGSSTRWKATSYGEGMGWLEARGTSLIEVIEALRVLAMQRVAEQDNFIDSTGESRCPSH
jgi:hypothetical protein